MKKRSRPRGLTVAEQYHKEKGIINNKYRHEGKVITITTF